MSATRTKPQHVNGEEAAEKASKAKADAQAKAKAEEEAAVQAKAEEARKGLKGLEPEALSKAEAIAEADSTLQHAELELGEVLIRAEALISDIPGLSIGGWAGEVLPDLAGPVWGSSRAYRTLQAAKVAALVPGGVGTTRVDALVPLYRLRDVDSGKAIAKVYAKAKGRGRFAKVTRKALEDAMQALYPSNTDAAKGPAKGSQAAKAGATAKAAKAGTTRNTPTKGEVLEVPDKAVSATTLKAAALRLREAFDKVSPEAKAEVLTFAMVVAASAHDYGTAATAEGLRALLPMKQAAKRTRRTTRTTK